jgi:SAM-dependent methyltransferase
MTISGTCNYYRAKTASASRHDGRPEPNRSKGVDVNAKTPELGALTAEAAAALDYNRLIGVVRETNRPPGGLRSIALVSIYGFLSATSHVLEVGTSTGVTAVELARLTGCRITAIDINESSLAEGRRRADAAVVGDLIDFERRDATRTGYLDRQFDMVFCGNVTSLIPDRDLALAEYTRVLKVGGFLAAIPMYYVKTPSASLVADVSAAIQVDIEPLYRQFWIDFFVRDGLHPYWQQDFLFDPVPASVVDRFVDEILDRPHLAELGAETMAVVARRYRECMHLFRENLGHMGYTNMLLRREPADLEPELFTSTAT